MHTVVTERGQISIPAEIRRRFRLLPKTKVEWLETPEGIFLMPIPRDPIRSFRGKSKGLLKILLESRREDRRREK